jgi:soluble lytic murein transglycosylase-like protein/TolA-binding protein
MLVVFVALLTLAETPFGSSVDRALNSAHNRDWKEAMAALDQAWMGDAAAFEANNLYYLRGRLAEEQQDWVRALDEFSRLGANNPLRSLAAWHGAHAAIKLGFEERAGQLINEFPWDFPQDLRMRLARDAQPGLALKILDTLTTREARLQKAILRGDIPGLWGLVRERKTDDAALESARRLVVMASTSAEWKDLASIFIGQRQFAEATVAYQRASEDPKYAAESQYQLARIHFLSQDYAKAVDGYRAVAAAFPGTNFGKNAEYEVGNSYWRLRQYEEAEKAYQRYIDQYSRDSTPESAIRDLADIYRSLGQGQKAIALIDRTLVKRLTVATRQVLLFTKAKILYSQGKYAAALQVVRQLKGSSLRTTSGGTSAEELVYLEALCLAKTGNVTAAKTAWKRLAGYKDNYYGQLAALQLGLKPAVSDSTVCQNITDRTREAVMSRLLARRRPYLTNATAPTDVLTELMFLGLWDEASVWIDQTRRPDSSLAADLQYVSGRYNRAIAYADRLPRSSPEAEPLRYPAGYRSVICEVAAQRGLDPLWLHAIIWQESKYNAEAHSGAAARGLMQFIPDTAHAIAVEAGITDLTLNSLYNPEVSIKLGAHYWAVLLSEFKSPELALAAYNGGPDNVRRWRDKWPGSDGEFFVSDIGFTETKLYVQSVFSARAAYGRIN